MLMTNDDPGAQSPLISRLARATGRIAIERLADSFRRRYGSFTSRQYLDDERTYKLLAAERLRELLGRDTLRAMLDAQEYDAAKSAILSACGGSFLINERTRQPNNLLNQWDVNVLRSTPAEPLATRLYDLLYGAAPFAERFDAWVALLSAQQAGVWPQATYFLMLSDPASHIFVKPTPFQFYLKEVAGDATWRTKPDAATYARYQQLARELLEELAPLGARDMIDAQSFIWIAHRRPQGNAWIFQANPRSYDLPGALAELDRFDWGVRQYAADMRAGDTAFLWESGANGGVLAVARVLNDPVERPVDQRELRFYRDAEQERDAAKRVSLQVEQVLARRLARDELRDDAVLSGMEIFSFAQGTIFKLTPSEEERLHELIAASEEQARAPGGDTMSENELQLAAITTQNPLNRALLDAYPARLKQLLGDRVQVLHAGDNYVYVKVDGRLVQQLRVNMRKGAEIWFFNLDQRELALLREELPADSNLRQKDSLTGAYPNNWRFNLTRAEDLDILMNVMHTYTTTRTAQSAPIAPSNERRHLTFADAAYLILSRAGGGPLTLSEITQQIQEEELVETRSQTPQLTLSSAMLRDERFQNLGRNTWVLAMLVDEAPEPEEEAIDPELPEPPTRAPRLYAEEQAGYWRIHFPRELWPSARRNGVIGIREPLDSAGQSTRRFRQIRPGDRIVAYVQGGVIGGIGIALGAFDPQNPRAGLPADIAGDELAQCIRVAWADAPAEPVSLFDALRHTRYTQLYNRLKNLHAVMPLDRESYAAVLSLLQVDDAGAPASESRLPATLPQLTGYLALLDALPELFSAAALLDAARTMQPAPAALPDADDLVVELQQLRLIEAAGASQYRRGDHAAGARAALLRLCALALLVRAEGAADSYTLPARAIVPRLRTAGAAQPAEKFAPELGADGIALLAWYAEAGLATVAGEQWQPAGDALAPLPGDDPATQQYNLFLRTLLAELDGTLTTDLPPVSGPLPPVADLDGRLRELSSELLIDETIVRRVYRSLLAGRHVVLSGPPGTGKTELATRLPALLWREEPQTITRLTAGLGDPPVSVQQEQRHGYAAIVVTATEDWSVRDVVGGIGPQLDGENRLGYTIQYGTLTQAILRHYDGTDRGRRLPRANNPARSDYRHDDGRRYRGAWLVIDEFNRAPVDAAFGSLLTTLSGGDAAQLAAPAPGGELRSIPLPPDFRIIGTLNSFDRHFLNQISEALKRRFDFIDVLPPPPHYADAEQGIAARRALQRLKRNGFAQAAGEADDPQAIMRFGEHLSVAPHVVDGVAQYRLEPAAGSAAANALRSFWRIFSAVRVFRQLGTAQMVAIYTNLFAGVAIGMRWEEALDTALADALADQLQVLDRDAQRMIAAYLAHAASQEQFAAAVENIARDLPAGRRLALLQTLAEAGGLHDGGDAATPAQLARVFDTGAPLMLPEPSVFRRRLRDLSGDRGV
jgi:MoxR-like ATPase/predicted RNA-binding protein with PUA-like domain